uniref:Uncharacterized protein n=1 Tax=Rhizophagus irregularis (strain DAOM 181602 / DAOM 197198 / MUCL 43194) TaxID=747089 RepID=U9T0F3_RHIID
MDTFYDIKVIGRGGIFSKMTYASILASEKFLEINESNEMCNFKTIIVLSSTIFVPSVTGSSLDNN